MEGSAVDDAYARRIMEEEGAVWFKTDMSNEDFHDLGRVFCGVERFLKRQGYPKNCIEDCELKIFDILNL